MFDNSMVGHISFLVISICSSKGQGQSSQSWHCLNFESFRELGVQWVAALMCSGLWGILILRHITLVSDPFTERSMWSDWVCLLSSTGSVLLLCLLCQDCLSSFTKFSSSLPVFSVLMWKITCFFFMTNLEQNQAFFELLHFFFSLFPSDSHFCLALWKLSSNRERSHNIH